MNLYSPAGNVMTADQVPSFLEGVIGCSVVDQPLKLPATATDRASGAETVNWTGWPIAGGDSATLGPASRSRTSIAIRSHVDRPGTFDDSPVARRGEGAIVH